MPMGYNGTADIWIDGQGTLSLKRSKHRIISQRFPYSGSPCGDSCPLFDAVMEDESSRLGYVDICMRRHTGELQDSRE